MFESNYLLIMGLSGIVISLLIILHEPIFDGIDRIVARITVKKVLKKIDLYNGKIVFKAQIASSSWTPSGRKLGLPQPLRLRKQCQGMLQRVLLECSTPDSSSEGC